MILLGWKIGSGERVEIPETGHLAWFGQTQLSGKTTALEAIAFRGGLRAVAFITKQGEGGFLTGRMIPPYFSEPTNDEEQPLWRWVKSILEASQQRKMNFEESWIIRACEDPRQANTLAEVHQNIKTLLTGEGGYVEKGKGKKAKREWKYTRKPVSGMNAGVYTSLKAYFDIVMPQLARLPYTKKLSLGAGLNVMDLRGYAMETQALVIRSVMEWVYQHEKNVRVIVPEAQDFVPQGKNSPVKMACETLVRKAGANKNFMWLDSQDMAAVDKVMLRACSIVGIGVQTEGHEIDRSLAGLFTPTLRPIDIARLKIGEFFVRTPEARVSKVYVQPAWMDSEVHAQAIAKGEESVTGAKEMLSAFKKKHPAPSSPMPHGTHGPELLQVQIQEPPGEGGEQGDEDEADAASAGEPVRAGSGAGIGKSGPETETVRGVSVRQGEAQPAPANPEREETETVWKEKYEALLAEHKMLVEAHDALAEQVRMLKLKSAPLGQIEHGVAVPSNGGAALSQTQEEIYRYIIQRASEDPKVLEILTRRPELRIAVERPVLQVDGASLRGQLGMMIKNGFFNSPATGNTAYNDLVRRGQKVSKPNVYRELDGLANLGFVTKEDGGYQAVPDMKVNIAKA